MLAATPNTTSVISILTRTGNGIGTILSLGVGYAANCDLATIGARTGERPPGRVVHVSGKRVSGPRTAAEIVDLREAVAAPAASGPAWAGGWAAGLAAAVGFRGAPVFAATAE